jgi:MFS family permease
VTGAPGRLFYGWWVAASFAAMVFLSSGLRFSVGPFLKPMVADLGLDRASFSLVISLELFLYGMLNPFVGRLVDRLGARLVTTVGTLVLGGSVAASALATELWHLYLIQGVGIAVGLAATGPVVGSAVISRWFVRRRATALSAVGSASMAGMSALVPVVTWSILTLGWRGAFAALGAAVLLVLLPLALWVVRDAPETMGLHPDGTPDAQAAAAGAGERTPLGAAVQTAPFWQLGGALFGCGFSMSLVASHGVPMLTDHGYHPMTASWALAVLGGSSMAGAMVLGVVADRVGRRPVLAWLYASRLLLFAGLFLVRDSATALLLLALLGGTSMSGTLAMGSALTADIFGRRSVGSVFGTIFLGHQVGAALGSWLGGLLFELTGGYGAAFTLACAQLGLGALVSLAIDVRPCPARLAAAER